METISKWVSDFSSALLPFLKEGDMLLIDSDFILA